MSDAKYKVVRREPGRDEQVLGREPVTRSQAVNWARENKRVNDELADEGKCGRDRRTEYGVRRAKPGDFED